MIRLPALPKAPKPKVPKPTTQTPALPADWMEQAKTITDPIAWHKLKQQLYQADLYHTGGGQQALYSNPLAAQFDTETSSGHGGLFSRIRNAYNTTPLASREGRIAMAKIAAFVLGAQALGTATAGAGASGSGATGGFVEGSGGGPSLIRPSPGLSGLGSILSKGSKEGGGSNMEEFGGQLLQTGIGAVLGGLLNRGQQQGKDLSRSPFESGDIQRYLPPGLRYGATGPSIEAAMAHIGDLLKNPGGLSPDVAEAINPRLSAESQNIAAQYRGMASNQAGAAARSNLPVSIKTALQSALDIAQERAQRGARGQALTESEALRREDLSRVYSLLDAILQFTQAGRGTATAGLAGNAQIQGQRQAANMALIASLLGGAANGGNQHA